MGTKEGEICPTCHLRVGTEAEWARWEEFVTADEGFDAGEFASHEPPFCQCPTEDDRCFVCDAPCDPNDGGCKSCNSADEPPCEHGLYERRWIDTFRCSKCGEDFVGKAFDRELERFLGSTEEEVSLDRKSIEIGGIDCDVADLVVFGEAIVRLEAGHAEDVFRRLGR